MSRVNAETAIASQGPAPKPAKPDRKPGSGDFAGLVDSNAAAANESDRASDPAREASPRLATSETRKSRSDVAGPRRDDDGSTSRGEEKSNPKTEAANESTDNVPADAAAEAGKSINTVTTAVSDAKPQPATSEKPAKDKDSAPSAGEVMAAIDPSAAATAVVAVPPQTSLLQIAAAVSAARVETATPAIEGIATSLGAASTADPANPATQKPPAAAIMPATSDPTSAAILDAAPSDPALATLVAPAAPLKAKNSAKSGAEVQTTPASEGNQTISFSPGAAGMDAAASLDPSRPSTSTAADTEHAKIAKQSASDALDSVTSPVPLSPVAARELTGQTLAASARHPAFDPGQLSTAAPQQPAQASLFPAQTLAAVQLNATLVSNTAAVPLNGLAVDIALRAAGGKNRFEIRLDPAELGRIDVRLDVDKNGQVTSHVTVEKPATLDLLRRDAPQLQRALEDAGLKTGDSGLQFSLRDQSSSGRNHEQPEARNAQRLIVTEEIVPAQIAGKTYGRVLGSRSGVDIRI